jgi:hypothetical protein
MAGKRKMVQANFTEANTMGEKEQAILAAIPMIRLETIGDLDPEVSKKLLGKRFF